jgi:EmrB/QacA subfamily drug resistance transporter
MITQSNKIGIIIAGLLLSMFITSMDNTIVVTAMGTIVGELGGLDKFFWVTAAYGITEIAGMPIFGKLSDMYGRKRFFVFGMIIFILGSVLCSTADSIVELSIYRAVQGIGAGALIPLSFTIMLDIVAPENRGKLVGMFGAVFGLSSILGPLVGAYITDFIGWQWIFYINLPLGLITVGIIAFFYKESFQYSKQPIDWWGAISLIGAIISLMFALELGGKEFSWISIQIIGLLVGFVLFTILFLYIEKRAKEPIISFHMFRNRLYATSNLIAILSGAAFGAILTYIPIFIQGVLGGTATNSGLVLLPMMIGSVLASTSSGFLMTRMSYRSILIPSLIILVVGLALLTTLKTDSTQFTVTIYMILMGLSIGATFSMVGNAAIHPFTARQQGTASATNSFLRSLGMILGITIFGIIQSHVMTRKLIDALVGSSHSTLPQSTLLDPVARAQIPSPLLDKIIEGFSSSIIYTFAWSLVPAVLALATSFLMSNEKLGPREGTVEKTASSS